MKRLLPLAEVAVALALFVALRGWLRDSPLAAWQAESFGSAPVSSTLLLFVLPLVFVLIGGRNPGLYGLATHDLSYHRRVGLRAAFLLLPVTLLFPLMPLMSTTHERWLGGLLLTVGVLVAGYFIVQRTAGLDTREPRAISPTGTSVYLTTLILGAVACFAFHLSAPVLARIVQRLIFVGFLEEFFFRGYLQSRLNDAFGRPYRLAGVPFGLGLLLSAAIFGLAHPLTSPVGFPLPWALWTAAGGLVFGFVREKTGSALAPAIAHGIWVLPTAFFSP